MPEAVPPGVARHFQCRGLFPYRDFIMDTPEQPTVWPPAPTLPPPQTEGPKPFKLRLSVPEWVSYWWRSGLPFFVALYIIRGFCEVDQLRCPRWCSVPYALAAWFVTGGLMTAWKYRLKKNKE